MSLALYRKYRPQNFGEIIGQDHIVSLLQKSLLAGKTHHAYLFVGSRGTGKTSTARIVAKAINCSDPISTKDSFEPCGKCFSCLSIREGSYLDLLEIDAASNRGIDEIRDLREKIRLAPTEGKYKIYLIDEVHMLTNEAFNALLKTLEEPPAHAVFILCTTDPQKLPATIISRCLRVQFHQPNLEDIKTKLEKILEKEGFEASKETLEAVAKAASGAFRDGEVLLEKLISEIGENLKELKSTEAEKIIGIVNRDTQYDFLSHILDRNAAAALEYLDLFVKSGGDVKSLNITVLEQIRHLLLASLGFGEKLIAERVSPQAYKFIQDKSDILTKEDVIYLYNIFTQSLEQLKFSPIPELPLEVAIAEIIVKNKVSNESDMANSEALDSQDLPGKEVESSDENSEEINKKWLDVIKEVRSHNNSLYAVLKGCGIKSFDGKILTLSFPYSFHKDRLDEPKNRKIVEKIISEVIGSEIKVKGTVDGNKKRDMKSQDLKNVESVSDEELLDKALDIFNGKLETQG